MTWRRLRAAPVCGNAAVARQRLANVLESVKSAGLEVHPDLETTDSWTAARVVLRALKSVALPMGSMHIGPTLCHRGGGAETARVQDAARRASAGRYSHLQLGTHDAAERCRQDKIATDCTRA